MSPDWVMGTAPSVTVRLIVLRSKLRYVLRAAMFVHLSHWRPRHFWYDREMRAEL